MCHWRQRRVEAHIFIALLAFLLSKTLELKLRAAGFDLSIAHAFDQLAADRYGKHVRKANAGRPC